MPLKKTFADLVADLRERGVPEMDLEELAELREERDDLILIDIREDREWVRGRMPGAIHIGRGVIERKIEERAFGGTVRDEDLDRPIVCYCQSGARSLFSVSGLQEMGFANVHSLEGGFTEWVNTGGEVVVDR